MLTPATSAGGSVVSVDSGTSLLLAFSTVAVEAMASDGIEAVVLEGVEAVMLEAVVPCDPCQPCMVLPLFENTLRCGSVKT